MTRVTKILCAFTLALACGWVSAAEPAERDLEAVVAPVALYPDALLSQLLMAATFPQDVSEAALWSRQNGLRGEAAVRAAMRQPWDASVQALTAYPGVLGRMDEQRDWTRELGQLFLARESEMLDAIQRLRTRAYASGQLRSGQELQVRRQGANILVESASNALPRGLVYSGFDWAQRHTHVASIRMQAPLAVAVQRTPEERPAVVEPHDDAPKPEARESEPEPTQAPVAAVKPVPLVGLLAPAPKIEPRAQAPAAAPEPTVSRPAPLVDLGKPPPVQARRAPASTVATKSSGVAPQEGSGAELLSLMPSALSGASDPQPAAKVASVPSVAPSEPAKTKTRPASEPAPAGQPGPRTEVASMAPAEPLSPVRSEEPAPRREEATPKREAPTPKTAGEALESAAALVAPAEVAAPKGASASAVPVVAKRPPRAFVSDGDRRTLDAILGPSIPRASTQAERR